MEPGDPGRPTVRVEGVFAGACDLRAAASNLWDRRFAVVDEERGIVLTILRFGKIDGVQNGASVTSIDRIVAEFFTIKAGKIQEVQAVMTNRADQEPTGWDTRWYGPGRGGWSRMPTGQ